MSEFWWSTDTISWLKWQAAKLLSEKKICNQALIIKAGASSKCSFKPTNVCTHCVGGGIDSCWQPHVLRNLFQILQLKARMAEDAGRMLEQETMQLCVLGKTLAEDADFLDICRGFKVSYPFFWTQFQVENSE